jgi:hypothetical protein
MPPRDPTNAQISSRLSYAQNTPSFLLKLQNRIAGIPDEPDPEDEYGGGEFYDDGSGRPPIPQRPAIPERPEDDPGSADEDDGDEKPQVVVLREGKHLTEREAENERRKGGLLTTYYVSICFCSSSNNLTYREGSSPTPRPKKFTIQTA